jgi:glycosyltransferase involved in cell wall biosynthesis
MPTHPETNDTPPKASDDPQEGRITAVVPARDEEQVIATCVRGLAQQTEITQIVVVDDQSTDHTAKIVRELMGEI